MRNGKPLDKATYYALIAGLAIGARLQMVQTSTLEKARGDWVDVLGLSGRRFDLALSGLIKHGYVEKAAGILFWTGNTFKTGIGRDPTTTSFDSMRSLRGNERTGRRAPPLGTLLRRGSLFSPHGIFLLLQRATIEPDLRRLHAK